MSQDLESWLKVNKLTKLLSILNENEVEELEDLTALGVKDIEELADEMNLKVVSRKKFIRAAKKLIGANNNDNDNDNDSEEKKTDEKTSKDIQRKPNKPNHVGLVEVPKIKVINPSERHRTIMVIGATGTGKTTLLNSMVNYLWDVDYEDPFRYKLVYEPQKAAAHLTQAQSQTDHVTAYHLNPPALEYQLTVIDTPGFGDTRGIANDIKITANIKKFFETKIQEIDAVCFVIRAPQARLTPTQKYIFNQVLGIFGNDIKENILVLLTFADNEKPPALAALAVDKVPFKESFKLNNSGFKLPEQPKKGQKLKKDVFGPLYWEMGIQSFAELFQVLDTLKTKSLTLTRKVLTRRQQLEAYVVGIKPSINKGFEVLEEIRQQIIICDVYADKVNANKDFMVDYIVHKHRKDHNVTGNTTTCLDCNYTCHKSCAFSDNADKKDCSSMDSEGNCRVCPDHCHWMQHKNLPYYIEWYTEKKKKPIQDLKDKYCDAMSKQSISDQIIAGLTGKYSKCEIQVNQLLNNVRDCINELSSIALRPNVLDQDDYLDKLIASEESERKKGWQERCKTLRQLKQKQEMLSHVSSDQYDPFAKYDDVKKAIKKRKRGTNCSESSPQKKKQKTGYLSGLFS